MTTDDPKLWAALISGILALIGTVYVAILNYISRKEQDDFNKKQDDFKAATAKDLEVLKSNLQTERDERLARQEAEKIVSKFRDPLLNAAYDLQSRIYNIVDKKKVFLQAYYSRGSELQKEYAVENTVFLVAQFLGWTELTRQEIQFIDLGSDDETRELRNLQDRIYGQFQTDGFGKGFQLFAGDQRAIGELMIDRTREPPRCLGYAAFLKDRDENLDHWLDPLREDVKKMARNVQPYAERLISIQNSLIDLLKFLDPEYVYFPRDSRSKIGKLA